MALALSATTGMCAVAGSARRIFSAWIPAADTGQIDIHQDDIRPGGARKLDAEVSRSPRSASGYPGGADEILDQLQVGRMSSI